jgi:uncharacterized protein YneF (UPF0154 family)
MDKIGVITLIIILAFILFLSIVFYIYIELSKKSLQRLKDNPKIELVECKKNEIYIFGGKLTISDIEAKNKKNEK